jgi:hypothetical protein
MEERMNRKLIFPALVLVLTMLACNLPAATTSTPTLPVVFPTNTFTLPPLPPTPTQGPTDTVALFTDTPGPTPTPGSVGQLTLDQLKNATVHAISYDRTVALANGSYSESSGTYSYTVNMLDVFALGDLNGDGKAEAAAILAENGGGSGTFISLVVFKNNNGQPDQIAEANLGDRVLVKAMDISSAVVHLDMQVHGPADGLCCPSLPSKQNYWLFGNRLQLMKMTTIFGGTERVITITMPNHWATLSNPFTVQGVVSVLPFENTLAYRLYLIDGTKVTEGSLIVTPTGGTTGNFSQTFNLSAAGITDWVIVQFVDYSAADGSINALGSVIMKAK